MNAVEWAESTSTADTGLTGLAQLERLAIGRVPTLLQGVDAAARDFSQNAERIVKEHGGRELMREVNARMAAEPVGNGWTRLLLPFFLVVFPTITLALLIARRLLDLEDALGVGTVLSSLTIVICAVLAVAARRTPGTLGPSARWSTGAAIVAVIAAVAAVVRVNADTFDGGPNAWTLTGIIGAGAVVLVLFAVVNQRRHSRSRRSIERDLAPIKPRLDKFVNAMSGQYDSALQQIVGLTSGVPADDQTSMVADRNAALDLLVKKRLVGFNDAAAIKRLKLGELQIHAVTAPIMSTV